MNHSTFNFNYPRTVAGGDSNREFDHHYALWNQVLNKYATVEGAVSRVNYRELKKHPEGLSPYLDAVERVPVATFAAFSEKEKLAFLINAYNALTVKLVLDHYPVKSIKDIGGLFSSPWKMRFFKLFGEKHHLDDIEHEMIRKRFNEPRIHFALVCASKGCPGLRKEAFSAERLDEQLDLAADTFLRDSARNHFDAQAGVLHLSSIFKWYGGDFEKKFGSVVDFVAPRMSKDRATQVAIKSAKIEFLDYDWSLNE